MIEKLAKKLQKELAKKAKQISFCSEGGQHIAPDRNDTSKCGKCGLTIAEIKEDIAEQFKQRYPHIEEEVMDRDKNE